MRRLDGYLSRRAQLIWPGALVYEEPNGDWCVEWADATGAHALGLGDDYSHARQAVDALMSARRQMSEIESLRHERDALAAELDRVRPIERERRS